MRKFPSKRPPIGAKIPSTGTLEYVRCDTCQKRDVATIYEVRGARWYTPPIGWIVRPGFVSRTLEMVCSPECALEAMGVNL